MCNIVTRLFSLSDKRYVPRMLYVVSEEATLWGLQPEEPGRIKDEFFSIKFPDSIQNWRDEGKYMLYSISRA